MRDKKLTIILLGQSIGVAVMILLFLVLDFIPQGQEAVTYYQRIEVAKKEARSTSHAVKEARRKELESKLIQIKGTFDLLQKATREIRTKILKEKNIPLATLEIEDLATRSNVNLVHIKPLDILIQDQYEVLPIELQMKARFVDLIPFLMELRSSQMIMNVSKISINSKSDIYPLLDVELIPLVLYRLESEGK